MMHWRGESSRSRLLICRMTRTMPSARLSSAWMRCKARIVSPTSTGWTSQQTSCDLWFANGSLWLRQMWLWKLLMTTSFASSPLPSRRDARIRSRRQPTLDHPRFVPFGRKWLRSSSVKRPAAAFLNLRPNSFQKSLVAKSRSPRRAFTPSKMYVKACCPNSWSRRFVNLCCW